MISISPIKFTKYFRKLSEKRLPAKGSLISKPYFLLSQTWLPTVQEVLQADWQDAWHSPQPPEFLVNCKVG